MKRLSGVLLGLVLVATPVIVLACDWYNRIDICHATGSETNPFVQIKVDLEAIHPEGAEGHNGHPDDIIPVFWYLDGKIAFENPGTDGVKWYEGKNWDTAGRAIYRNGCNVPPTATTPPPVTTETPVPTFTSTLVPTETQTNTPEPTTTGVPTETPVLTEVPTETPVIVVTPTDTPRATPTPKELPPTGNEASASQVTAPWRIGEYTWAGHADGAFANVPAMQVGDIISFDGKLYRVWARVIVNPDATQMIDRPGYDLELVTCTDRNTSGVWEHRLFILAMAE